MAIVDNITAQLNDYRGTLIFPSVTDSFTSTTYPLIQIPLLIKQHDIPIRKPKITEVVTITNLDPTSTWDTNVSTWFSGGNNLLQLEISGSIITPTRSVSGQKVWDPFQDGSLLYVSYPDLISAYIEGTMRRSSTGRCIRIDPIRYIDPYGNNYGAPKIFTWEPSYAVNSKRQTFNMTLLLEV